jgi:3-oxoadipate enol-lactonase
LAQEEHVPWIEANGTSFHYKIDGSAGPTVVLLHELGGTLDSWDGVVPGLAARYRVFRYDQRGSGLSEKVRAQYTLDTLVDDMQALLGALKLAGPYHVVSIAAASTQALLLMERDPKGVASLVFCNPAPGVDASRAEALEKIAAQAEREGIRGVLPQMLDRSYPPELSDRETYDNYRGRYLGNDPVGFALAFRVLATTDKRGSLGAVACPAMVVGGNQDVVRPVAGSQAIAGQIPGARFEAIDAGHFMPATNPKALLALLLDFLPH